MLNGFASIDGMSHPCSFGCEYRWNVASSLGWVQVSTKRRFLSFQKFGSAGIDLMSFPHDF